MLFLALRTHFNNPKYDFFKMNGKLRASKDSYNKRHDKLFFEKIAKRYTTEELKKFYVANFLEDRHYIAELLEEDAHGTYFEFEKRRQSLSYIFKNDLDKILENGVKGAFQISIDEYPPIVIQILRKTVSLESAIVLNDFVQYDNKFDKYLKDDVIWSKIALKMCKYRPFIKYDFERFKSILREKINENTNGKCI